MGSTFILNFRICQKNLKPLFQGSSTFFTHNTFLCKSPQHLLCTRNSDSSPGDGQKDRQYSRQGGVHKNTIRHNGGESWGYAAKGREKSTTVRQSPSFPKSVFAAGTAKRTSEILRKKAALLSQDVEQQDEEPKGRSTRGSVKVQPPDRPLSTTEWRQLRETLGNPQRFDIHMMGTMFTYGAKLDIAKSLLTFVAMETGTLSYELLLRYLTLCVSGGHNAEVYDVYDIMRGSFPSLDTGASTLFIKSFSQTERWREAFSILQELKKVFSPSPRNYGDVISGAMAHGDTATAWALYDELIEKGLNPLQETWDALFKAKAVSQHEQQQRLLGILFFMRDNQIYPQYRLASTIKTWFEHLTGQTWTGSWTSATPKGVCGSCGCALESIQLTSEEYRQLKDRVMADIIQGQDVFKKTTPEELERFKTFVKRKPVFDVVVDGLNVANINADKSKLSETLLAVVSELVHRGLNVLVLGRKHMLRPSKSWDRRNMDLIRQKAHCFFTENISEDDPFLLYATLHSGNHCRFVSRDLMRDHKACLSEGATRRLFFKWQRGHQMVVDGYVAAGRSVRFLNVPNHDTIVQTSADSWHIPYDDTDDRGSCEVPQKWLCLTKKQ